MSDVEEVRLAHLSDPHLGAHDDRVVDLLVSDVAAFAPAATVVTGDLTLRAREEEFALAVGLLRRLPDPQLVVLGNHDIPLHNLTERLTDPYAHYTDAVTDDLDPVLDLPGARILGLQSMPRWRWKSGRVSKRQAGLVADVLGAAPPGRLRVLAMHHPPASSRLEQVVGRDRLHAAMAAARVDVVLAGHTHVPATQVLHVGRDGGWDVVEIVAGTAGSTRLRGGIPMSWNRITIAPDTVTVQERRIGPQGWGDGPVSTFRRQR